MQRSFWILIAVIFAVMVSCSRSGSRHNRIVEVAETLMLTNSDSALTILEQIDPTELTDDSIRAKYHYVKGWSHLSQNRSLIGDSQISFAYNYYRGKDMVRETRSSMILAWYRFWTGDTPGAISLIDSVINRSDIPDLLLVQTLRIRVFIGVAEYQGQQLVPLAKRLVSLESDSFRIAEAKNMLINAYEYAGELDSALMLTDELIDYYRANHRSEQQFSFNVEKAQVLSELGRYEESDEMVDAIFSKSAPDNGAADYLHLQHSINALNRGDIDRATRELAVADSFAVQFRSEDDSYYRSFSNVLHTILDFKQTGRMKLLFISGLNNRQMERFSRMKASQWEAEREALLQQSRTLALKAESRQKTVVILITGFIALAVLTGAVWITRIRRNRERENEERIEALQKLVDEFRAVPAQSDTYAPNPATLRRGMLQQLGIIKMVAETPTEQNREMLRKISSIDGETNGELVNWENVYEVIDNLYSGFYTKLHSKYGTLLSDKEERIIVLMAAGFSTKEISVITGQTTSTIYVRKSSIRKKLATPEKEDIVRFINQELTA